MYLLMLIIQLWLVLLFALLLHNIMQILPLVQVYVYLIVQILPFLEYSQIIQQEYVSLYVMYLFIIILQTIRVIVWWNAQEEHSQITKLDIVFLDAQGDIQHQVVLLIPLVISLIIQIHV